MTKASPRRNPWVVILGYIIGLSAMVVLIFLAGSRLSNLFRLHDPQSMASDQVHSTINIQKNGSTYFAFARIDNEWARLNCSYSHGSDFCVRRLVNLGVQSGDLLDITYYVAERAGEPEVYILRSAKRDGRVLVSSEDTDSMISMSQRRMLLIMAALSSVTVTVIFISFLVRRKSRLA